MLHLKVDTSVNWVEQAVSNMDTVLLDHAHCEKKAAATAINLIFRYPHHAELLRPLSALAREELEHFEQVLDHLDARGIAFKRLAPSDYAGRLIKSCRQTEPERIVDTLLCCALIEARSCERMGLLARALEGKDAALSLFYASLLKSEARHHMTYVKLAACFQGQEQVYERLEELAQVEAEIISELSGGPRMHN